MSDIIGTPKKGGDNAPSHELVFSRGDVEAKYKRWFPDLSADAVAKLSGFHDELLKKNKVLNLISAPTLKNAEQVHFADAILASRFIVGSLLPNSPLYDAGGGNGIPGLVIAILQPALPVIIVDRDSKKTEFVQQVAGALKLANVSVQPKGLEELPPGTVLNAVVRGAGPLQKSLLALRKQFPKGGRLFHLKGDAWANELAQVPSQLFSYWSPSLLGQYKLPETSTSMSVVMTEKIAE